MIALYLKYKKMTDKHQRFLFKIIDFKLNLLRADNTYVVEDLNMLNIYMYVVPRKYLLKITRKYFLLNL